MRQELRLSREDFIHDMKYDYEWPAEFSGQQYDLYAAGVRDVRMHDNALCVLADHTYTFTDLSNK